MHMYKICFIACY